MIWAVALSITGKPSMVNSPCPFSDAASITLMQLELHGLCSLNRMEDGLVSVDVSVSTMRHLAMSTSMFNHLDPRLRLLRSALLYFFDNVDAVWWQELVPKWRALEQFDLAFFCILINAYCVRVVGLKTICLSEVFKGAKLSAAMADVFIYPSPVFPRCCTHWQYFVQVRAPRGCQCGSALLTGSSFRPGLLPSPVDLLTDKGVFECAENQEAVDIVLVLDASMLENSESCEVRDIKLVVCVQQKLRTSGGVTPSVLEDVHSLGQQLVGLLSAASDSSGSTGSRPLFGLLSASGVVDPIQVTASESLI
jgi:hypothetical protein